MAGATGIFNFLHRRLKATGFIRLHLAGDHQFTGGRLKFAGQLLELRLFLPHIIFGTGVVFFAHAREMLPRLMGQRIQFDRTLGELGAVKWDTPAQHPAQVFTSLEHLLEDRLALAQGRIRINAATGGQCQAGQQYNGQSFKSHGGFEVTGNGGQYPRPARKDQ